MRILFVRSGNMGIDPITQNQAESLINLGIEVVFFDIVGKGFIGYIKNLGLLRETIKKTNADIIHAHYSLSGYLSFFSFPRIPIVVSLMGSDVVASNKISLFVIQFFCKYLWEGVIVKSDEMMNRLKVLKAKVIPNGVNLEKFKPMEMAYARELLNWPHDARIILFASNPNRSEKNFTLFDVALRIVSKQIDGILVKHLFNVNRDDVPLYYNAADVLVLTSKYEGSPNVIKEAMACNCPIVATKVGDIKANIKNTTGCYLTSFEASDVAGCIIKALSFNNRTSGRDDISFLDSKVVSKRILKLYQEIIK